MRRVTVGGAPAPLETPGLSSPEGPREAAPVACRSEFLYFAFRNWKFVLGLVVVLGVLVLAIVGPMITDAQPLDFSGPTDRRPSSDYWFGTTSFGQDVFAQFVNGLRATFLVGDRRRRVSRGSSARRSASPPATAAGGSTTS